MSCLQGTILHYRDAPPWKDWLMEAGSSKRKLKIRGKKDDDGGEMQTVTRVQESMQCQYILCNIYTDIQNVNFVGNLTASP